MLHSLIPQSPINSNPNANSTTSPMKAAGDHDGDASKRHKSLSGEVSISGEKAATKELAMSEGESESLRLLGLLLQCAECVALDNLDDAAGFVPEMSELSSPFGSSVERVAAYFGDALQARKNSKPSSF